MDSAISVLCIGLNLSHLPSYPPSLGTGLLTALLRHPPSPNLRNLFVFSVGRLVSRRCHPIGSIARASGAVQYYEGSDSWTPSPRSPGLPTSAALPSDRSTSNHSMLPTIALTTTTAWSVIFRLRHLVEGSPSHAAESSSLSCGPIFHLQLLPTPPHGDAVSFGYGVVVSSDTDLHRADKAPSWAHNEAAQRGFRNGLRSTTNERPTRAQ